MVEFKGHQWTEFDLEQIEKLEQLRWLANGFKIGVTETALESIAIDHPADLVRLEKFFDQL